MPIYKPLEHPYPPVHHMTAGAFVTKNTFYWLDDQMRHARQIITSIFNSAESMGPVQMEIINSGYINPHPW